MSLGSTVACDGRLTRRVPAACARRSAPEATKGTKARVAAGTQAAMQGTAAALSQNLQRPPPPPPPLRAIPAMWACAIVQRGKPGALLLLLLARVFLQCGVPPKCRCLMWEPASCATCVVFSGWARFQACAFVLRDSWLATFAAFAIGSPRAVQPFSFCRVGLDF